MKDEAYGSFALAYDQALGARFFAAARQLLAGILRRHPPTGRTHLDIACGTGLAVRDFMANGWKSVGVDISLEMLGVARTRASRLVAGDFRALPLRGPFSLVTCLYDSYNHMRTRDDLRAAFRAARGVMNDESLFVFDMNHPEIYEVVWGASEPFVSEGDDHYLEIATTFRRRDGYARAVVSGWADRPAGRVHIRELRQQRAWSEREILELLRDAGIVPAEVIRFDPYGEAKRLRVPAVKLVFVCRTAEPGITTETQSG